MKDKRTKRKEKKLTRNTEKNPIWILLSTLFVGYPLLAIDALKKHRKSKKFWSTVESTSNAKSVFGIVVMAISLIITLIVIIMNWNTLHECFQELDKAKKSWESHEQVVREPAFHINTSSNITSVSTTATTTTTIATTIFNHAEDTHQYSEDDKYLLASFVSQETGSIDYLNPFLVDNNFNLYPVSIDLAQQCAARILINQMHKSGSNSIRETLSDTTQWDNSLFVFDNNGNSFDSRILHNVELAIAGETPVPDNVYYEMCSEPGNSEQLTHDIFEVYYDFMQPNYTHEIDVYMFSKNSDGTWWMACSCDE